MVIVIPALIFSKFRFGWKMGIHAIPQKPSSKPSLQAFMVVAEKQVSSVLQEITSSFNDSSLALKGSQVRYLEYMSLLKQNAFFQ